MYLSKYFDINNVQFHLELKTFVDAKPYRIVLTIKNVEKSIYFWYGEESTLKLFGKYVDDAKHFGGNSLAEYKIKIIKFLTNS